MIPACADIMVNIYAFLPWEEYVPFFCTKIGFAICSDLSEFNEWLKTYIYNISLA